MPEGPSPHRFLPGHRQPSPTKTSEQPATLRREVDAKQSANSRRAPTAPSLDDQFARTPRFAHGKPSQHRPSSPQKPTAAQALFTSLRPIEDVEEVLPAQDVDEELLDNEPSEVLPTTEQMQHIHDEQAWNESLPYSPKRRRLNGGQTEHARTDSPSKPTFRPPRTPASHRMAGLQQFTRAGSVAGTVNHENAGAHKPAFLRSSIAPSDRLEPLPEAFSPHRRGEKFIPGGMAATLQQWIIEAGQSAAHSRRGQGYLKGEDYVKKIKVDSRGGQKPLLVQGRQPDGSEVRLLLVVDAKKVAADVEIGSVVGIRAPTWALDIHGEEWHVGVDWKVL